MSTRQPLSNITGNSPLVKSSTPATGGTLSDTVRHHSTPFPKCIGGNRDKVIRETTYYGVSLHQRILPPGLLNKHFDHMHYVFEHLFGLTTAQREVVFRLTRLGSYYGKVYPKASQICSEPGCSKATYWRTIRELEGQGLIHRIPRILYPRRRQISDLYLLHKLFLIIARYLAEHGTRFWQKWLEPYLAMPGRQFWTMVYQSSEARAGP